MTTSEVSRRRVLGGAVAVGTVLVGGAVGYTAVAASGLGDAEPAPEYAPPTPQPTSSSPAAPVGTEVSTVDAIADGGGAVLADQKLVLVRSGPDVHGFSAVCTHAGCLVDTVTNGEIRCPCHGSVFAVADGSVVSGPASSALATVPVTVHDGKVYLP
jgi:Rieske Fe-S protein